MINEVSDKAQLVTGWQNLANILQTLLAYKGRTALEQLTITCPSGTIYVKRGVTTMPITGAAGTPIGVLGASITYSWNITKGHLDAATTWIYAVNNEEIIIDATGVKY